MKKKILLMGIVAILIISLFLLTGCGNNTTNENQPSDGQQTSENGNSNRGNGMEVLNVIVTSNNYAVVSGDDSNYYIIDNKGNAQGQLNISSLNDLKNIKITNKGNVYIELANEGAKIYDKTGKIIFEKTSTESYEQLTDFDYTIKGTITSDFESGSSLTKEIIDLQGNTIKKINKGESYIYLGGHIWIYAKPLETNPDRYEYFLYNDETDKTASNDNIDSNTKKNDAESFALTDGGVFYNKSLIILGDLNVTKVEDIVKSTGDMIVIDGNYYYKNEDKTIYKWDGTKVKEITSGDGLKYIENIDGKYYVKSGTSYYYTMDDKFESTSEPFKIETEKNLRTLGMAKDAIIVEEQVSFDKGSYSGTWDHVYIYGYDGKMKEDLGDGWDAIIGDSSNFIYRVKTMTTKELNERSSTYYTKTVGNIGDKFINKNTGEILKIYK